MTGARRTAPIEVLLVEDSVSDAALAIRALEEARIRNRVHVATDGEQALAYLRRRGAHVDAPEPDLILLDLNLPKVDGRALLGAIKHDAALQHIPVIVLTGSSAEEDIARSHELHASAYVTKPVQPDVFLRVLGIAGPP